MWRGHQGTQMNHGALERRERSSQNPQSHFLTSTLNHRGLHPKGEAGGSIVKTHTTNMARMLLENPAGHRGPGPI